MKMDSQDKTTVEVREGDPNTPATAPAPEDTKTPLDVTTKTDADQKPDETTKKKDKCGKKHKTKSKKAKKRAVAPEGSSDSDSDEQGAQTTASTSDSSDSESEVEEVRKKRQSKKRNESQKIKKKAKAVKKVKKPIRSAVPPSDSDSTSSSDSDEADHTDIDDPLDDQGDPELQHLRNLKQMRLGHGRGRVVDDYPDNYRDPYRDNYRESYRDNYRRDNYRDNYPIAGGAGGLAPQMNAIYDPFRLPTLGNERGHTRRAGHQAGRGLGHGVDGSLIIDGKGQQQKLPHKKRNPKASRSSRLDYKRVDQVWDNTIHNYKLQDTAEGTTDAQYDEYLFHVRRTFDWEGKYKQTVVDIKSKLLREALQDVIGNIKGVSLVEDTPKLDPNMLFL